MRLQDEPVASVSMDWTCVMVDNTKDTYHIQREGEDSMFCTAS